MFAGERSDPSLRTRRAPCPECSGRDKTPSPAPAGRQRPYTADEAVTGARTVLPDILTCNRAKPATYPNGRVITDDVSAIGWRSLTNGKVTSDGLTPHDDVLPKFPYLSVPNL
jgi:hypothetical protein